MSSQVITNSDGHFHETDNGNLLQISKDEALELTGFSNVEPEEIPITLHPQSSGEIIAETESGTLYNVVPANNPGDEDA